MRKLQVTALASAVVAFFAAVALPPGAARALGDARADGQSAAITATWQRTVDTLSPPGPVLGSIVSIQPEASVVSPKSEQKASLVPLPVAKPVLGSLPVVEAKKEPLVTEKVSLPQSVSVTPKSAPAIPYPQGKPAALLNAAKLAEARKLTVHIPDDLKLSLDSIPGGKRALFCLALNDYYEARGEPLVSRLAVAKVVMNRTRDRRFPRDVCSVVKESRVTADDTRACQFSWQCEGGNRVPEEENAWRHSLLLAAAVLYGGDSVEDPTGGALWFHSASIQPAWAEKWQKVGVMGRHAFYVDPRKLKKKTPPAVQLASLPTPVSRSTVAKP